MFHSCFCPITTKQLSLLIEHWPAVEEIIQSEANLRTQLSELLLSLKKDLNKAAEDFRQLQSPCGRPNHIA
jgi:hypothetical protein